MQGIPVIKTSYKLLPRVPKQTFPVASSTISIPIPCGEQQTCRRVCLQRSKTREPPPSSDWPLCTIPLWLSGTVQVYREQSGRFLVNSIVLWPSRRAHLAVHDYNQHFLGSRYAVALQAMKETPTLGARPTLAHSPLVGQTLCVNETVRFCLRSGFTFFVDSCDKVITVDILQTSLRNTFTKHWHRASSFL